MQRILDPTQIEAFAAQRSLPRVRLPDSSSLFAKRAQRLLQLSASDAVGHAIGDYLGLMAALANAQQSALASVEVTPPTADQVATARKHGMPLIHAVGYQRDSRWRRVLVELIDSIDELPGLPANVRDVCARLRSLGAENLEAQADALLATRLDEIDAAMAPFIMGALQVYWTKLASGLGSGGSVDPAAGADGSAAGTDGPRAPPAGSAADIRFAELDVPGVCPLCGTLPVASIVRADKEAQGHRYLHCALCATEWHMVRVTCSHCQETKGLTYHSIEGGSEAIRAESCSHCHTYRKIFYQEKDMGVEPVADDLASIALDLLLSEEGYHRASGNPLLWQGA